jgi:hypothetical protein
MNDVVEVNSSNYSDQIKMTVDLIAAVLDKKDRLSSGEVRLAEDLKTFLMMELNVYSRCRWSEKSYWQTLLDDANKRLKN